MPTFLLIRHGENDYVKKGRLAGRKPGVHLNDNGRAQARCVAELLAKGLKEAKLHGVYSSPLERTMETAEPVAQALGLEIIPRPGLLETDYGDWLDKSVKGLSRLKIWRTVQNAPSLFTFPGGESFAAGQQRIASELRELGNGLDDKDVVICVSHADPIKLAVAYFLGLPLDLFQRLGVSPASVSALHIGQMSCRLLALNYTPDFFKAG